MFLEGKKLLYPYVKYSLYGIIVWSVILFFLWRNFLGKIYIVSVLSDIERRGCYG